MSYALEPVAARESRDVESDPANPADVRQPDHCARPGDSDNRVHRPGRPPAAFDLVEVTDGNRCHIHISFLPSRYRHL